MNKKIIKTAVTIILVFMSFSVFAGSEEVLYRAKTFYKQKKFHLARDLFEKILTKSPLDFNDEACLILGNIYDHHEEYEKAIKMYQRGIEITKKERKPLFYINLAQTYRHQKKYIKSLITLKQVEDYSDTYPEIFLYKGMAFYKLRAKQKTITAWEAYLVKVPYGNQSSTIRKAIAYLRSPGHKWPEEIEREKRLAEKRKRELEEKRRKEELERQRKQRLAAEKERKRLIEQERKRKQALAKKEKQRRKELEEQRKRLARLEEQQRKEREKMRKLREELARKRKEERLRRLREQRDRVNIKTKQVNPNDRGREEGKKYDEIER